MVRLALGIAIGYMLGAKAVHERYEQIMRDPEGDFEGSGQSRGPSSGWASSNLLGEASALGRDLNQSSAGTILGSSDWPRL